MTDKMLARKEGAVAWLTFNNPDRLNAVSLDMWEAVSAHLADFAADDAIRVVVVTGAGERAFVSGADISEFEKQRGSEEAIQNYNKTSGGAQRDLRDFPKPMIAMIRGYCIGGGLAVALACDLRIATEDSQFGIPAARLGLGYGMEGLSNLVDVVGPAFAKEIMFTAKRFNAQEAAGMGIVNRVLPAAELEGYVADYTQRISENAPLTVAAAKRVVTELVKDPAKRDVAGANAMVQACFDSQDYIEGRTAFMEKRKPAFQGH